MGKKKIIIVINNLEIGGVQKSFLNLLKEIRELYDISVLVFYYKESYRKLIPDNIKIIPAKPVFRQFGMSTNDAKKSPYQYLQRIFWYMVTKLCGRDFAVRAMSVTQKAIEGYDAAISFLHEGNPKKLYGGCNSFVIKNIEAKKKIAWIHCDFALCGANSRSSEKLYSKFDQIVACSEGARQSFIDCMPQFEKKCIAIRNCNDYEEIRCLAGNGIEYEKSDFNIVTVARLSNEKGIDRAILAIKACLERGYKIKYHIVGYGNQEEQLKAIVKDNGLSDNVVFYGKMENPYPYMKNADLFMLTSYHEAAPMVFDEAACLGVPVLATKTTSTEEMIHKNHSGIVCENSQSGITETLLHILSHSEILSNIKKELEKRTFTNAEILDKFAEVINFA